MDGELAEQGGGVVGECGGAGEKRFLAVDAITIDVAGLVVGAGTAAAVMMMMIDRRRRILR